MPWAFYRPPVRVAMPHSLSAATTTKSTLSGAQLVTTKAVWLAEMWWVPLCMSGSPPAWPCILALLCSCHSLYGLKSWGQQTLVRAAWLALVMPVPCYSLLSTFFGNRIKLYSLGLEKQEFSSHSRQTKTLSKCHKQNGNKCVGSWHSGKRRIYGIDLCELTSWYCIP